ncbi:MAG: tetratricopeptide repeat protein [Acidobacteriia bacterium]|nr:tetratricopeptide repeat protein [Terriglobia bacterium]MBV8905696.1 tetratricopeptide repeat protein [Terriglobia bacterium]
MLVGRSCNSWLSAALPGLFLAGCIWHSAADYVERGNQFLAKGNAAEAALNYRKAIQKNPNFGEAYYRLGSLFVRQRSVGEALTAFETAARLMPAARISGSR